VSHGYTFSTLLRLTFCSVPTEEHLERFPRKATPYRQNDIRDVDWDPPFVPDEESELGIEQQRRLWRRRVAHLGLIQEVFFPYRDDMHAPAGKARRQHDENTIERPLTNAKIRDIEAILDFCIEYHADDELFLVFQHALGTGEVPDSDFISTFLERIPTLVFVLLRVFPPSDDCRLHLELSGLGIALKIIRAIVRSANETRVAALVALEKLAGAIATIRLHDYVDLLMQVALSVRAKELVQEVLLVLNDSRLNHLTQPIPPNLVYAHKHALNVVFDRAEEAADECPCTDDGRPRSRQQTRPAQITLAFKDGPHSPFIVKGNIRVDQKHSIRLHSHIRLKATSKPENRFINTPVLDGLVIVANKGEYRFRLMQPAPQELEKMDWLVYDAGSIGL
jgi:regulator of nonsense transcripts 1